MLVNWTPISETIILGAPFVANTSFSNNPIRICFWLRAEDAKQPPRKKTTGPNKKFKHKAMWKHFDALLADVSPQDLIQINAKIIEVINDYLDQNGPAAELL